MSQHLCLLIRAAAACRRKGGKGRGRVSGSESGSGDSPTFLRLAVSQVQAHDQPQQAQQQETQQQLAAGGPLPTGPPVRPGPGGKPLEAYSGTTSILIGAAVFAAVAAALYLGMRGRLLGMAARRHTFPRPPAPEPV